VNLRLVILVAEVLTIQRRRRGYVDGTGGGSTSGLPSFLGPRRGKIVARIQCAARPDGNVVKSAVVETHTASDPFLRPRGEGNTPRGSPLSPLPTLAISKESGYEEGFTDPMDGAGLSKGEVAATSRGSGPGIPRGAVPSLKYPARRAGDVAELSVGEGYVA
jgi:hypothetical protein